MECVYENSTSLYLSREVLSVQSIPILHLFELS